MAQSLGRWQLRRRLTGEARAPATGGDRSRSRIRPQSTQQGRGMGEDLHTHLAVSRKAAGPVRLSPGENIMEARTRKSDMTVKGRGVPAKGRGQTAGG